ncbi:MerR family transcriptional regulator [Actinomadura fibrosa]|uniref:MerR family transcriptional regulator n=1 Tax=Actinomadura fibrosa TaxID=111802 RepID=A0ABW2XFX1_9ACTN|nr:MerR family transcriptional regulator [Actinomadura fibrosa]
MLIGEVSRRTGVNERLLRYYERQGLITSRRLPNGYRDYDESVLEKITQIRALLAAGLPTRLIHQVIPCANGPSSLAPCPGVLDALRDRLTTLDQRAADLAEARTLLRRTITRTEQQSPPPDLRP